MKRTLPVLAVAALALAACNKPSEGPAGAPPTPPASADRGSTTTASAPASDAGGAANVNTPPARSADGDTAPRDAGQTSPPSTPTAPMLAMAYKLGLVIPADQVRPLMESHQEACERAGPDQCQVLAADASASGDDKASAELTLRATPAWMRMFRTRAEADAKDLGGKIEQAATEGDDLSGSIVDTEAAQKARAAEEARLAELMKRRTSSLQDTLQVEQQITEVQGEMDQAASELAAMKGRIDMQTVTIAYQSPAMVGPRGATAPLAVAARSFVGNFFAVVAGLIMVASFTLPFVLVGAPIVWWLRRRKTAQAQTAKAPSPVSPTAA